MKKMDSVEKYVEAIIKEFESISGKYNTLELFYDWIDGQMGCLNVITGYDGDGSKYLEHLNKAHKEHTNEQNKSYNKIFTLLKEGLRKYKKDILGRVAFKLASDYDESLGLNLTENGGALVAGLLLHDTSDIRKSINEHGYASLQIYGIGSGSVVLSSLEILEEEGIDLNKVYFVTSESNIRLAQMAIMQLTLLDVKAVVTEMPALIEPLKSGYISTPLAMDLYGKEVLLNNMIRVKEIQNIALMRHLSK